MTSSRVEDRRLESDNRVRLALFLSAAILGGILFVVSCSKSDTATEVVSAITRPVEIGDIRLEYVPRNTPKERAPLPPGATFEERMDASLASGAEGERIVMSYTVKNTSDSVVKAIRLCLALTNVFGDTLQQNEFSIERSVAPGEAMTLDTVIYDAKGEVIVAMREAKEVNASVLVQAIVFAGGKRLDFGVDTLVTDTI